MKVTIIFKDGSTKIFPFIGHMYHDGEFLVFEDWDDSPLAYISKSAISIAYFERAVGDDEE